MPPPLEGLNPLQGNSALEHRPKPIEPQSEGKPIARAVSDPRTLTIVTAAGLAILATNTDTKVGQMAFKGLTGFKPPPINEQGIVKPTPFALLLLAPQPIGLLPERFFQGKPRIPGTNLFADPIFTATEFKRRRDQRKFESAQEEFREGFKELLPTIPEDDLRKLFIQSDLKAEHLAPLQPFDADALIRAELDRRRQQLDDMRARERQQRIDAGTAVPGVDFIDEFPDRFFADNPADP